MWSLIPIAVLAVLAMEGAMAIGKTLTLFSEIDAKLVDASGAPQSGIKIERWWRESTEGDGESDTVTTAADGSFRFPAISKETGVMGLLPGTPAIKQRITAHGPDGDVRLWFSVKNSFDANSEFGGRPVKLICRIDQEPDGEGPAFGTCRIAD